MKLTGCFGKFGGIIAVFISVFFLGCERKKIEPQRIDAPRVATQRAAAKAYEKAVEAIIVEPKVQIDVVWTLNLIADSEPNQQLKDFAMNQSVGFEQDPLLLLVKPDAPRVFLPDNPSSGIVRFSNYLKAPCGKPPERAVEFIADFTSSEEEGYVLTHQFLVLELARQTGLELPRDIRSRKNILLKKIYKEQISDNAFSDLYAERAAILLFYGSPQNRDADKWIDVIVMAQNDDGNWPKETTILSYDREHVQVTPPTSHTTALSLWALHAYLSKY